MGPGSPVLGAESYRKSYGQAGQKWIHTMAQQKARQQCVGQRDQQPREDRNGRQAARSFGERVNQLASVLEADERGPGRVKENGSSRMRSPCSNM